MEKDVENLITAMKKALPMYAYPAKYLLKEFPDIYKGSKLEITDVLNLGDEGGISCCILRGNTVAIVSVTHLNFVDEHPLRDRINKYKFDRIQMLKIQHHFR